MFLFRWWIEMGNYLHPACIGVEFQYQATPAFTDWCDEPALLAAHVHNASGSPNPWNLLDARSQSEKESRAKLRLNNAVAASMTLAQLCEVDANGEILGWFQAITTCAT